MFNPLTIQNCFTGLVGFRQTSIKGIEKLDADLVNSSSGLLIDSMTGHPLITMENLLTCAQVFRKDSIPDYDNATTYAVDDLVVKTSIVYRCIQEGAGHDPATSTTYWTVTNVISAYLRTVTRAAGINVFNAVFLKRKLNEIAKTVLSDTSLYEGTGSLTTKVVKFGRFVGYRIKPKYRDTIIKISSIGLQLDTLNPDFKLYVYQSSSLEATDVVELDHNVVTTFGWHDLEDGLELAFSPDHLNDNCYFYIGYYEDDLIGQAIWKQELNFTAGCSSCNNINSWLYRQWSNFFDIQPMYVTNTFINEDRTMFEEDKQIAVANQNWGMNFKIQVHCDVSNLICRNKTAFTEAIKLQIVHDLLNNMAFSMRDNNLKSKVSEMAFYALENKENYETGIRSKLEKAIAGVSFDISGVSQVCLPCVGAKTGIKVKSVYS
jgi:hypothetical protein